MSGATLVADQQQGGIEGPVDGGRLSGFDGLRAIAATLIVLHHAGYVSGLTILNHRIGPFLGRSDVGVPIFFVISGFLLYRPFVAAAFRDAPAPNAGRFWLRRFLRIFPAYWAALVLQLVIGGIAVHDTEGFVRAATLTHVYDRYLSLGGITQSWSLATEIAFYALLPFFAAATAHRFAARSVNRHALRLLGCCAAIYLLGLVWRIAVHELDPNWREVSATWLPSLADHFALGMALAVVSAWADHRPLVRDLALAAGRHTVRWWLVAGIAFWFVSTQLELRYGLETASFGRETFRQVLYGLVGLALVAPVALHPGAGRLRALLDSRVLVTLGVLSYGIYLWHQFFLHWVARGADWAPFSGHFIERFLLAYLLSIAAAWLSYRIVERPAARFRR